METSSSSISRSPPPCPPLPVSVSKYIWVLKMIILGFVFWEFIDLVNRCARIVQDLRHGNPPSSQSLQLKCFLCWYRRLGALCGLGIVTAFTFLLLPTSFRAVPEILQLWMKSWVVSLEALVGKLISCFSALGTRHAAGCCLAYLRPFPVSLVSDSGVAVAGPGRYARRPRQVPMALLVTLLRPNQRAPNNYENGRSFSIIWFHALIKSFPIPFQERTWIRVSKDNFLSYYKQYKCISVNRNSRSPGDQ